MQSRFGRRLASFAYDRDLYGEADGLLNYKQIQEGAGSNDTADLGSNSHDTKSEGRNPTDPKEISTGLKDQESMEIQFGDTTEKVVSKYQIETVATQPNPNLPDVENPDLRGSKHKASTNELEVSLIESDIVDPDERRKKI
jgi:hypothetical protein